MTFQIIINILAFAVILLFLFNFRKKLSFNKRVGIALVAGIIYGFAVQNIYGVNSEAVSGTMTLVSAIGSIYVRLLRMIVVPLIFVAITSAIINQAGGKILKSVSYIIAILVATTAVSAFTGIGFASIFDLNASEFPVGEAQISRGTELETALGEFQQKSIPDQIVEIVPANPFYSMTGQGPSATLSVVFFAAFIGIAAVKTRKRNPESFETFKGWIKSLHDIVMSLVRMVLKLTPYGVMAQMAKMMLQSDISQILVLGRFVAASYAAILTMYIIHLIILAAFGISPAGYMKKSLSVLAFAFSSRSSAATLPLNVEAQMDDLGVSEGEANLSASLGTSIGQNGCAGIYPAMLAFMIAPTVGINPLDIRFIVTLVIVTAISSFGVAGVGGGATFAALTVLSAMGLPVGLVGVLIAIEPLIDMGRTALNVNGSMISGIITSKLLKTWDKAAFEKQA